MKVPLLILVLLALRIWFSRHPRPWVGCLGAASLPGSLPLFYIPRESNRGRFGFPIAGFLLLTCLLVFMEVREPFFFTQDDNLSGAMPNMVPGCRSFWAATLPNYNPYLGLGAPMMNRGMDAYTYPLTHVAYGIARLILQNEYAMLEVWAFLHILGGFWATYFLGRYLGLRPWISTSIALAFVLSGQALIVGRSWFNFFPPLLWQPLMFLAFARFIRGEVGIKWAVGSALVFGMFFHAGFPQVVILTLLPLFAGLGLLLLLKLVPVRRLYWMVPTALFSAALCLPLFLQQWRLASDLPMDSYGSGIRFGFINMILPSPLANEPVPNNFVAEHPLAGQVYYFGTVFALLAILSVGTLFVARMPREVWRRNIWVIGLLVMADFCMGENGFIYPFLHRLGHANLWHYPWRSLPCVVLLALVCGALILEGLIRENFSKPPINAALGIIATLLIVYHATLPLPSFCTFGFKPYPALPPQLQALLLNPDGSPTGRVWAVRPYRSPDHDFVYSMGLNFPTIYGVASAQVYDPIYERSYAYRSALGQIKREPLEAYRAYGIRWVIVSKVTPSKLGNTEASPNQFAGLAKVLDLPSLDVYEVAGTMPFAFFADSPEPIKCRFDHAGLHLTLAPSARPRTLIVNVLSIPDLHAYAGDQPIEIVDETWDRVKVTVPAGATKVDILYQPPWMRGVAMGGVFLVTGIYSGIRLIRKDRKLPAASA